MRASAMTHGALARMAGSYKCRSTHGRHVSILVATSTIPNRSDASMRAQPVHPNGGLQQMSNALKSRSLRCGTIRGSRR